MEELGQFLQKLIARDRKYLATILLAYGIEIEPQHVTVNVLVEAYQAFGERFINDLATAVPPNLSFAEGYQDVDIDPTQPWLGTTRVYNAGTATTEKKNVVGFLTDLFKKVAPVVKQVTQQLKPGGSTTQVSTALPLPEPEPVNKTRRIIIIGAVVVVLLVVALIVIRKLKK